MSKNTDELIAWLREVCVQHFAATGVLCWHDGDNLCFHHKGTDSKLWLAVFPNPFGVSENSPVCCLAVPARLVTLYRSDITNSDESICGLLDELLDELKEWS
jgi:hypothetical protein